MTIDITLAGNRKSTFIEGSGFNPTFQNSNTQRSVSSSRFESSINSRRFKVRIRKATDDSNDKNVSYITEDRELEINSGNFLPFKDFKRNFKIVKVKSYKSVKIGENNNNTHQFYEDLEKNYENLESKENFFLLENSTEDFSEYYPFSFNYNNFFFRNGRIDVFKNVAKIKFTQTHVDDLLGFNGNTIGTSKNAFGENVDIKYELYQHDSVTSHFEDNIDQNYLFLNSSKTVIDKIDKVVDYVNNTYNVNVTYKTKHIHSQETRYFIKKEVSDPFYEMSMDTNDWRLEENENLFKALDNEINQSLLSRNSKSRKDIESKTYTSFGRSIDNSLGIKRESVAFYGEIN